MDEQDKQDNPQDENKTKPDDPTGADKPKEGEGVKFSPEQQEFLNKLINRAKDEGKESAKKELEAAQAKAKEEAERQKLADDQKWKELSDKQQADLTELTAKSQGFETTIKALTEERDRYKAIVENSVKEQRKGLPEHLSALLDNLDPVAQMEWLAKNADKVTTPAIGTPRRPASTQSKTEAPDKAKKPVFSFPSL